MAALINSLPEGSSFIGASEEPSPLRAVGAVDDLDAFDELDRGRVSLWLSPVPEKFVRESLDQSTSDPEFLPTADEISNWLEPYPTLAAHEPGQATKLVKAGRLSDDNQLRLTWTLDDGEPIDFTASREMHRQLITYPDGGIWQPAHTGACEGFVIPVVGQNTSPVHPLATWWAILYSMSMLARYHPDEWTRLLNIDRSKSAERIRHVLDTASDELPWLIVVEVFDYLNGSR